MLESGNGGTQTVMPLAPMYGMGNSGFGDFGGNGWWFLLFIFAMFGNNGFGGWGGNDGMYPYFFNAQTQNDVNRGFDNQILSNQIGSVQASVDALGTRGQLGDIQTAISNGFSGVEIGAANRQMATMQQFFDMMTAFQNCCCENRLAAAENRNLISQEAAATRQQIAQTGQTVLDKLCQLELDGIKSERDQLRSQLQAANLQASQVAQTAQLMADNAAQTQYVVNRIAPYPVPSYTVQNPYTGVNNCGYNCGCGQQ